MLSMPPYSTYIGILLVYLLSVFRFAWSLDDRFLGLIGPKSGLRYWATRRSGIYCAMPESLTSARYYRGRPATVPTMLTKFYVRRRNFELKATSLTDSESGFEIWFLLILIPDPGFAES